MDKKDFLIMAEKLNLIHSEPEADKVIDPLYDIEIDIRQLMKKCINLENELRDFKNKTDIDSKKMLLKFIAVADAIENIFRNMDLVEESANEQPKTLISNFQLVFKMISRELNEYGVTHFETNIGDKVNPDFHNIIEFVEESGKENDTIVEVLRRGYLLKGKVLREADVKIIKNK